MSVAPSLAARRRRLWFVVPVLCVHLAMLYALVRTNAVESNPELRQPPLEVHLLAAQAPAPAALAPGRSTGASGPKSMPFDGRRPAAVPITQPLGRNLSSVSPGATTSAVHVMQNGASGTPPDVPSEAALVAATGSPAAGSTRPAAPVVLGSGGAVGAPSATPMAATGPKSMVIGVVCPTQVKPVMPRRAEREGLQGVVNARITLKAGRVTQVDIVSAQPRGVFDAAVRSAIEQYRCESPADVEVVTNQVFEFNVSP